MASPITPEQFAVQEKTGRAGVVHRDEIIDVFRRSPELLHDRIQVGDVDQEWIKPAQFADEIFKIERADSGEAA